jgi:4-alpha-glucanotransferase
MPGARLPGGSPRSIRWCRIMMARGSGILLPVSSLPSSCGIGDLGPSAYRFADFLSAAEQEYWQILPLNPTTIAGNNSPYMSTSAFAGNTNLISPALMVRDGFLTSLDRKNIPVFPQARVDYGQVLSWKQAQFSRAFEERGMEMPEDRDYRAFCRENAWWLDDYALFRSLIDHFGGAWGTWPAPAKFRDGDALDGFSSRFRRDIDREKFLQFIFFRQWNALHRYCNDAGIRMLGDLPIYVNLDSADVWVHPELFCLDADCQPTVIAGVPPDYFCTTGQVWKNPLYRWEAHERTGFSWWIDRFRHNFSLFDRVRIDHFRGFVAYYEIPAGATDATGGKWVKAPAVPFLRTMGEAFAAFPVIAEDLGVITPDVQEVMTMFGLPGMRVLQFAFTDETADNPHAPHNLAQELVLYTGTHDNPPVRGWFEVHATADDRRRMRQYLGKEYPPGELPEVFIRLTMMSVATTTILPIQDILGLGDEARINTPGTDEGNWEWRVTADQLTPEIACHLRDLTRVYGRSVGSRSRK